MVPDPRDSGALLLSYLQDQADPSAISWLQERAAILNDSGLDRTLYLSFSAAPRYFSKKTLQLDEARRQEAEALRPGFSPQTWTIDQVARVWLLLQSPASPEASFVTRMTMLFEHADMREAVALYSALPLMPHPELFVDRTAEGIRTNMTVVFDAIALDNPYPAEYLPEPAWNQMVLKAAFMDRPLYRIYGLEKRANPKLAHIISDYAHERWAAGRVVSPELWRPVGPFLNDRLLKDIERLYGEENLLQREAAALVCAGSEHPAARALLEKHPPLQQGIKAGTLSWTQLARRWWESKNGK